MRTGRVCAALHRAAYDHRLTSSPLSHTLTWWHVTSAAPLMHRSGVTGLTDGYFIHGTHFSRILYSIY